ncbi:MAG: beta-carotene 15,15'-dioxygenase, Brp/Blh family [Myxococcota bacterium]|nr:beta-carotene 15,15'-dioxygenase, Brp/Blh family [Myxococcota bacterium]
MAARTDEAKQTRPGGRLVYPPTTAARRALGFSGIACRDGAAQWLTHGAAFGEGEGRVQTQDWQNQPYDLAFCGLGMAACLVIRELDRRQLLASLKICVFEPAPQLENDKTLCFWATPDSDIVRDNRDLIGRQWAHAAVPPFEPQALAPYVYYQIESLRIYRHTRERLAAVDATIVQHAVERVESTDSGVRMRVGDQVATATRMFDSRPPPMGAVTDNGLLQSFLGYRIRVSDPVFDPAVMGFMDFSVHQDDHTQFVYTLPEDEHTALVEFTRFGTHALTQLDATTRLKEYIGERFGDHEILSVERGVIPMAKHAYQVDAVAGVIPLGTRAGAVKPSTGYAFETMYEHARTLTADLDAPSIQRGARFQFYDRLLIDILMKDSARGRGIFMALFQHQPIAKVLRFLHERTSPAEEASIFARLPWQPFIKAAMVDCKNALGPARIPLTLILVCLVYLAGAVVNASVANWLMAGLLGIGFLTVGLPHGALDHKVVTRAGTQPWNPRFLGAYLGAMGLMGLLWVWSPLSALMLFIGFSGWHFGQTDFEGWHLKDSPLAALWGCIVVAAIMGSHAPEVMPILAALNIQLSADMVYLGWPIAVGSVALATGLAVARGSAAWLASIALLVVSFWTPLLVSFGLYFVGQHSYTAWSHLQHRRLESGRLLWKQALPFTMGALALFGVAASVYGADIANHLRLIVIFGSCISMPHIVCMHRFYRRAEA